MAARAQGKAVSPTSPLLVGFKLETGTPKTTSKTLRGWMTIFASGLAYTRAEGKQKAEWFGHPGEIRKRRKLN
jgi:hypothetical protein